ncbi:hypothetical protein [Phenylobacterium aquaticum]|uniref:hypothetical protein n=1 Tax=Phenylobacterium aquaticum TaxID=1763816 RepID=UPI001F5CC9B0|nr:hypothetical protein [Phenylobacterium aquaticum]MCI3134188.1 hypothetical protein [Phenylobacterium aquaticum]
MSGPETAKTIIATMTRIDRVTKRATRERERKDRIAERLKRSEAPAEAATRFDTLVERLTRAHCVKYVRKDWSEIARRGLVEPMPRTNDKERAARRALQNYQPGMIDALFKMEKDRRRALVARVLAAAKADQDLYEKGKRAAEAHNTDVTVAAGVLALDLTAIESTLRANLDFPALRPALEGFALSQPVPGRFIVYIDALEFDALPDEACVAQPGGRAAYVALPRTNIQEMHLSNVCSISLRIGVEVLSAVGVDAVEVVTRCQLPVPGGKDTEQHSILYVKLTHQAMIRMDLSKLEPVSTVTALGGRLDWDATRGFSPISVEDLKLAGQAPWATPAPAAPVVRAQPAQAPEAPRAAGARNSY